MAIENTVSIDFYPRSSIVDYVFDCRLPAVIIVMLMADQQLDSGGDFRTKTSDTRFICSRLIYNDVTGYTLSVPCPLGTHKPRVIVCLTCHRHAREYSDNIEGA